MHGLVNRAFQGFLRDTYGASLWEDVALAGDLPLQGFEALLSYDDAATERMMVLAAERLDKPRAALLEDFGIYLAGREGLRRLLRFGGADFVDFLYSLEELPGRVRLAVPDLILPEITLTHFATGSFHVGFRDSHPCFAKVMCGVLQAMADDYGALAVIALHEDGQAVQVDLFETAYASGRDFLLTQPDGV